MARTRTGRLAIIVPYRLTEQRFQEMVSEVALRRVVAEESLA